MDPVLSRTRKASRELLRQLAPLPPAQQLSELNRILASFDPGLPAAVSKVADHLRHQKGMSVKAAVHEALARAFADSAIVKIQQMGARAAAGQSVSLDGMGLGALGADAGTVLVDALRGLTCSGEVASTVTDLVGRHEGVTAASVTTLGFTVGSAAAQCGSLHPSAPAPAPAPPPPAPRTSLGVPLAIAGAAVLIVGAVAFSARAK